MSTSDHHVCTLDAMDRQVAHDIEVSLRRECDDGREQLLNLYRKDKRQRWDFDTRIDRSQDFDPENPAGLRDGLISTYGSPAWQRLDASGRTRLRHRFQASQLSQSLHGEQDALVCSAKIVQQVPQLYAATQVMDEARHVHGHPGLRRAAVAPG